MRVRAGWSGEMANQSWRKADVDCDESDIVRIAMEFSFNPSQVTTVLAYRLLEAEANRLLMAQLIQRFGPQFGTDAYRAEYQRYDSDRTQAINEVRAMQGLA